MFYYASNYFGSSLSQWDTSRVVNMGWMFKSTKYNWDISMWNVGSVTDFTGMFGDSTFNQDISNWDVSKSVSFHRTFDGANAFNQNLCPWRVHMNPSQNLYLMFSNANGCPVPGDPSGTTFSPLCYVC
jgi:Mycoplasma protein of unknown function, DUF285